ncbi:MAG: methionine--tRNA ligase, partial [Clostridia bacterium]|nr:methionine--tRNA ligase [Clostridia bacterium]
DGKCPDCGREVHPAKEEAYFLKLSKYADRLIEHINTHPEFIQPVSRKNEMMNNFLLPGLQDLCVSRTSFKWGIPVDFDDNHVVYVWLDALSNYITGIGYDCDGNNSELYNKMWPADLHLIGKDIVRFHTIYWPIILMALDLPLPKQVFGHPWLLRGEDSFEEKIKDNDGKMSKSRGNVIYADDLVSLFGVDAVRYFVLHEMPFENDGVISWDLVIERTNSDLANVLGNLVNRTVSMTNKYFGGVVNNTNVSEAVDEDLIKVVTECKAKVEAKMDKLRVADAITEIFTLFKRCNKYVDETEPWVLGKDEGKKDRLASVLYNLVEGITIGACLLEPFMPETTEKILNQLNAEKRSFEDLDKFGLYKNGNKVVEKPQILFARLDAKEVIPKVKEIMEAQAKANAVKEEAKDNGEEKEYITIDDFCKVEMKIGEILDCEKVPESNKLLKSTVKVGSEVRTILSGISKFYTPEEMKGKKVVVVTNLAPRKMLKGKYVSEGMIVAAEDEEGNVKLLTADGDIESGAVVG